MSCSLVQITSQNVLSRFYPCYTYSPVALFILLYLYTLFLVVHHLTPASHSATAGIPVRAITVRFSSPFSGDSEVGGVPLSATSAGGCRDQDGWHTVAQHAPLTKPPDPGTRASDTERPP